MVEIVAVLNSRPPVEAISDVHSQVAISVSNILTTKSNVLIPHQECLKNSICTAARSDRYSTSPICPGQDGERSSWYCYKPEPSGRVHQETFRLEM